MKGNYILLINLENDKSIQIGKLGNISFKKGFYSYIGSAQNGLEQRINRHLRSNKKFHWHIDYFLKYAKIEEFYSKVNNQNEECINSNKFNEYFLSITKFGCSDCNCKSHLFYGSKNELKKMIYSLDFSTNF
jgi:Uri superfamily endonuclease